MELFDEELFTPSSQAPEGPAAPKLFTLIVVAKDAARVRHCQQLVNLIVTKFPCKVLFIGIDSGSKGTLRQQRYITKSLGAIPCDLDAVTASVDQIDKLSFLIVPKIIADLPAFLLVGGLSHAGLSGYEKGVKRKTLRMALRGGEVHDCLQVGRSGLSRSSPPPPPPQQQQVYTAPASEDDTSGAPGTRKKVVRKYDDNGKVVSEEEIYY